MTAIYKHRWASENGVQPQDSNGQSTLAGDTWSRVLAGISEAQIAEGLGSCLLRITIDKWPPAPPEFRALCLGIPSLAAFALDLRQPSFERKPFTRLAWTFIDSHRFRHADSSTGDRIIRDAYELACDAVMRGQSLPECAGILESEKPAPRKPAPAAVVAEQFSRISDILGDAA